MTRSELIDALAIRLREMPVKDIEISTKLILEAISQALVKGHRVEIRGFGSFSRKRSLPRIGRNPKNGEKLQVPAKYRPQFKPAIKLRLMVETAGDSCNTPRKSSS